MRSLVVVVMMATTVFWALPASAQLSSWIYEVRGGVLAHDVPLVGAGHIETNSVSLNAEAALAPSFAILGGRIRPVIGGTFTTNLETSWAYVDARYEWAGELLFFGIGVGPSIHTGDILSYNTPDHKGLGSRVLFHIPIEIGLQITPTNRIEAYYEHASNGFTVYPNPGMDNIGVRVAHRF